MKNLKCGVKRLVDIKDREKLNGHRSGVIWMTGLSAAGKSTIAYGLEEKLFKAGVRTMVLDGDSVRKGLSSDLGFSEQDRNENIRRIGEVAALIAGAGLLVIVAFISPYRKDRDRARKIAGEGRFVEVFVDCPLNVCEDRDPKHLYAKARKGELLKFTGVSDPYEAPKSPEIHLHTGEQEPSVCIDQVLAYLQQNKLIP